MNFVFNTLRNISIYTVQKCVNYVKYLKRPTREKRLKLLDDGNETTPALKLNDSYTSDKIVDIVQNYAKMQSRIKSNGVILASETSYQEELGVLIEQLRALNDNDYTSDWLDMLEHRLQQVNTNITVLKENAELYSSIPLQLPLLSKRTTAVADDDDFWQCTICLDKRKDTALGCGHVFCEDCAKRMNKCPNCKVVSKQRNKIYL